MTTPLPWPPHAAQAALSFRDPAEKSRRSPRRPTRAASQSSLRLAADRAPRLRRAADRIAAQAASSTQPLKALRLARDLRIRASQIECGENYSEHACNLELIAAVLAGI